MFARIWDTPLKKSKEKAAIYKKQKGEIDAQIDKFLGDMMEANAKTVMMAFENASRS